MERKLVLIPFLVLIQISFLPPIFHSFPNLPLISVLIFSLLKSSLLYPIFTGFFLDIFSENFFGYYLAISLLIYFSISFLKKYV
jgi:hypothetical protein